MSTSTEPLGSGIRVGTPSLIFLLHIKEVVQMRLEEFRKNILTRSMEWKKKEKKSLE